MSSDEMSIRKKQIASKTVPFSIDVKNIILDGKNVSFDSFISRTTKAFLSCTEAKVPVFQAAEWYKEYKIKMKRTGWSYHTNMKIAMNATRIEGRKQRVYHPFKRPKYIVHLCLPSWEDANDVVVVDRWCAAKRFHCYDYYIRFVVGCVNARRY